MRSHLFLVDTGGVPKRAREEPSKGRQLGSGSAPGPSFPSDKPTLPLGASEMRGSPRSLAARSDGRSQRRPGSPAPAGVRWRQEHVGSGTPPPGAPRPGALPPCGRCPPPAAGRSPRRRPHRPASPQGPLPPAVRAAPAWKPTLAQEPQAHGIPHCPLPEGVGGVAQSAGGAGRWAPSVRNFPLPNRRQRRLRRTAALANQGAREVGPRPGPALPRPRSPGGMRSPLATAGRRIREKHCAAQGPGLRGFHPHRLGGLRGASPKTSAMGLTVLLARAPVQLLRSAFLSLRGYPGSGLAPVRCHGRPSIVTPPEPASRTFLWSPHPRILLQNPPPQPASSIILPDLPPGPACFQNWTLSVTCSPCRVAPAMCLSPGPFIISLVMVTLQCIQISCGAHLT